MRKTLVPVATFRDLPQLDVAPWSACQVDQGCSATERPEGDAYPISGPLVSLTQVFDNPVRGREFFEEVIRDNLDLGRPNRIQLLVDRKVLANTPSRFSTRVITDGILPSLHVEYKRCHIKQYFKGYAEQRIMPNTRLFELRWARLARHYHNRSKNARTGSEGRYLPGGACNGAVRCRARSLMARLACK